MPSYAAPKPKPIKFKGKKQPLNPHWRTRAARGLALLNAYRNLGLLDHIEDQHALLAQTLLSSITTRSTNKTAAKTMADVRRLLPIAFGISDPPSIG